MNRTRKETEENKNIRKKSNIKNNRKRKKMKTWKKVLLVILLIIIAIAVYFIYNSIRIEGQISLSGMLATAAGHDENTRKNLGEFQVLIMGVSTDQAGVDLTDTIMVASYNPNTQRAVLLSIPRDSYTGKNPKRATASEKINAIYNLTKDPQETLDAVNDLTGLDIKYYMIVRTEALIELVDAIGPIEYDVPTNMNYDDLKDILMKKVDQELYNYKQNLIKNYTPEQIINEAYEINFKEQIRDILDSKMLGRQEMKVLLKTDNILGKLYDYWENSDGNIWGQLEDRVDEKITKMTLLDYQKNRNKEVR